jgi:Uma2 family endonuclease
MTVDTRLMTAEELLAMPRGARRYELVDGELITMSPSGELHAIVAGRIAGHLGGFVRPRRLGEVLVAEGGFVLHRAPDTVRAPDVSFLRAERVQRGRSYVAGAPDLAVEVVSPNDHEADVNAKVRDYLDAGTRMVVVVDPETETATVHRRQATSRLAIDDAIDGADVVPGWLLPLREVFEP